MEGRLVGHDERVRPVRRRAKAAAAAVASVLALSGCAADASGQWQRMGLPEGATEEAPLIGDLWVGSWVAALAVGVLVWGLILWAAIAYRKRNDEMPAQTRFNIPIEFLYTVTPLIIIGVLFYFTMQHQDEVLAEPESPDLTVEVIGQQWSWTFNYVDEDVYDIGTTTDMPTLYLPVDQTVRFELNSPDVIHSFWVPQFYMKMDVVPGRTNSFHVTPNQEGTFAGKCAEFCGAYHSRMLFNVEVVPAEEYAAQMDNLREAGQTGQLDAPLQGAYSERPLNEAGSEE
jgi:cytochrome c oxidase subunit II